MHSSQVNTSLSHWTTRVLSPETHSSIQNPHSIHGFGNSIQHLLANSENDCSSWFAISCCKTRLRANETPWSGIWCVSERMDLKLQDQLWWSSIHSESTAAAVAVFNCTITVMSSFYIESCGRTLGPHQIRSDASALAGWLWATTISSCIFVCWPWNGLIYQIVNVTNRWLTGGRPFSSLVSSSAKHEQQLRNSNNWWLTNPLQPIEWMNLDPAGHGL